MKISKFDEIDRADWDHVARVSPQAWVMHAASWIEIEHRFFVSANLSFALKNNGEVVGIQPLFLSEGSGMVFGERLLHSGIHRHTGLALLPEIDEGTTKALRAAAVKEVLALAGLYDVDRIQLNSHNLAPANRGSDREEIPFWVRDFGFHLGINFGPTGMIPSPGVSTVNADQLVDLGVSEETLFANLDDRASIRQANKNGLEFEISQDPSALDHYMAIAKASAQRTGEALPSREYYQSIFDAFLPEGGIQIAFARKGVERLAGLILLTGKQAASYLAGVSLPESLKFRPNDFLHWNSILWAKRSGYVTYRFGPWFPEVPREWPISKVSYFKTKFGSKSIPIIQGSLFRHPELYVSKLSESSKHLKDVGSKAVLSVTGDTGASFIAHHLRMFGFPGAAASLDGDLLVLHRPGGGAVSSVRAALERGASVVAVLPTAEFAKNFEVAIKARTIDSPQVLNGNLAGSKPWNRLRTLHSYMRFEASGVTPIVTDGEGATVWLYQPVGAAGILFLGTDLPADLMRYRQGDPHAALNRPTEAMWGFAGERPNYLFEKQLVGEKSEERHADWWCETLAVALNEIAGRPRLSILPNAAPGAVIITGDDDQATIESYEQQSLMLGSLPVTYFLHPLTKHNRQTMNKISRGGRVEYELHPDALDNPDRYSELLTQQSAWFKNLTGFQARAVRNHGFLNDGYWGHADAWIKQGISTSSNLPGVDGRVINGSLLPARLCLASELTSHWSILTAIGDGAVFLNDWNDQQSADCVHQLAKAIRTSEIPGIIVLNLHPQNVERTGGMHQALHDIVADGFLPWTLSDCIKWFSARDQNRLPDAPAIEMHGNLISRSFHRLKSGLSSASR